MKYIRDYDKTIIDEDDIFDDAASEITWDEVYDAMSEISTAFLFNHLDEAAQEIVRKRAIEIYIKNCYTELEEDEENG